MTIRRRVGGVGRWLVAAAILGVLTVVVTLVINVSVADPVPSRFPTSVSVSADAIAALREQGFQGAHPAEAGQHGATRSRHHHQSGRTTTSPWAMRSPSTFPPVLNTRGARCRDTDTRIWVRAHRRRFRKFKQPRCAVTAGTEGQAGAQHRPAGQPDQRSPTRSRSSWVGRRPATSST